jgi:hypothetical protein
VLLRSVRAQRHQPAASWPVAAVLQPLHPDLIKLDAIPSSTAILLLQLPRLN